MPTQNASSCGSSQPPAVTKRVQVYVACSGCRRRKVKCSGRRPACERCEQNDVECVYDRDAGHAPVTALKRKYEALQAQSESDRRLLDVLRTASSDDARKVLTCLRAAGSASSALDLADALSSRDNDAQQLPSFRPADGRRVRDRVVRRSPSAPDVTLAPQRTTQRDPKRFVSQSDPRLADVTTDRWGIDFLTDQELRDMLSAYFTWDHTSWGVFDVDDFCDALAGEPGDLSSRLLVFAVVAWAAKIYVYFDARLSAIAYQKAWDKARPMWDEAMVDGNADIATAVAGAIVCSLYSLGGTDKLGALAIKTSQQILLRKGFYDPSLVQEVYGDVNSRKRKCRAAIAWGILDYVTYFDFTTKSSSCLLSEPPVPPPVLRSHVTADNWTPWPVKTKDTWTPWPLSQPSIPAYTDEIAIARSQLNTITRGVRALQDKHYDNGVTRVYYDAALKLYRQFLAWMDLLEPSLRMIQQSASQQLIVLHIWYHFAVLELFRPFTLDDTAANFLALRTADIPLEPATSASKTATTELRQLLVRREALYGGLGTHALIVSPALAVAFEAMPTASSTSAGANYSPSAHMAFLAALRTLAHLALSVPVINFAILGIQHAASRMGLALPVEAERVFREAGVATKSGGKTESDWVVDFSRAGTDLEAARLDSLLTEIEALDIG